MLDDRAAQTADHVVRIAFDFLKSLLEKIGNRLARVRKPQQNLIGPLHQFGRNGRFDHLFGLLDTSLNAILNLILQFRVNTHVKPPSRLEGYHAL